jgi:hypothetical protein
VYKDQESRRRHLINQEGVPQINQESGQKVLKLSEIRKPTNQKIRNQEGHALKYQESNHPLYIILL